MGEREQNQHLGEKVAESSFSDLLTVTHAFTQKPERRGREVTLVQLRSRAREEEEDEEEGARRTHFLHMRVCFCIRSELFSTKSVSEQNRWK